MSASYTSRDRCIQALNQGYNEALSSIVSEPFTHEIRRISEFRGGGFYGVIHRILTRTGLFLHSYTTVLEFTAEGQAGTVLHEPMKCYIGAMVPATAPWSIYVKEISGFLSRSMVWVPYHKQLKASEVHEKKMDRSPLVDSLNADKDLQRLVKRMPDARTISGIDSNLNVSRWKRFEVKVNDEEDNHNTKCQVVPMGNKTLVVTQHVVENPADIVFSAEVVVRVTDNIRKNPHSEPVEGPVIQDWAEQMLTIMASQEAPTPTQYSPPPSTPLVKPQVAIQPASKGVTCKVCGQVSPLEYNFCGKCGARLEQPPRQCPMCGYTNAPDNNFCGRCGQSLTGGYTAALSTTTMSIGPMKTAVSSAQDEGRSIWLIQLGKNSQPLQEIQVWNLWEEGWVSPQITLDRLIGSIQGNSHYEWARALRHVYAPTGNAISGGYMHLTIKFNSLAPPPFAGKMLQILAVGQGRMGGFRVVGANEQTLTRELYDNVIELAITQPEAVSELTLWVPSNL